MTRKVYTLEEAVTYITNMGYPASKSTLYKQTMAGAIRFQRFGLRKLIFRGEDLDEWIAGRLSYNEPESMSRTIASAARRKEARK